MTLWKRVGDYLANQSAVWLIAEAVALVAGICWIDYISGYEVTFYPFYAIPILLAAWHRGVAPAIGICILSGVAWFGADMASGHAYSREWLRWWDAIVRLIFFGLVLVAGRAVRQQRDVSRARIAWLEQTQRLEREIISISEREQQRIGRDLHDGLGQYLVAIGFAADSLKADLEGASLQGAGAVGQIADLLHSAVLRARDLSRGLSPVDGHEGGLERALEQLARSASRLSPVRVSFVGEGDLSGFKGTEAMHLFRIAQEAVTNAIKHAQTKFVVIALEAEEEGGLSLRVSDEGRGFDPNFPAEKGMGLNIMRYRARMIGATLEISENSPSGTVVSCVIPAGCKLNGSHE